MAGHSDRRATPRLVSGATVRLDFRGAKCAKACANREDDRMVIFSRCARDDVWLKTFPTSNHRSPSGRMIRSRLCSAPRNRSHEALPFVKRRLQCLGGDSINSIPAAEACQLACAICAPKDGVALFSCSHEHIHPSWFTQIVSNDFPVLHT